MTNMTTKTAATASDNNGDYLSVEDVFSVDLYQGNGQNDRDIINGIDLSTYGGMVWVKNRDQADQHVISDSAVGPGNSWALGGSSPFATDADSITAFNTNGFTIGDDLKVNTSNENYVAYTWRIAPRFFDIVRYTGDGAGPRAVKHNLQAIPGMAWSGQSNSAAKWYHNYQQGVIWNLNMYNHSARVYDSGRTYYSSSSDKTITVGTNLNANGVNYVLYLFANNFDENAISEGFGDFYSETDRGKKMYNSRGNFGPSKKEAISYSGTYVYGSIPNVVERTSFEPRFIFSKVLDSTNDYLVQDYMRGFDSAYRDNNVYLRATGTNAEASGIYTQATARGFNVVNSNNLMNQSNFDYGYYLVGGPDRIPTAASQVFKPLAYTADNTDQRELDCVFKPDFAMLRVRDQTSGAGSFVVGSRSWKRKYVTTNSTATGVNDSDTFQYGYNSKYLQSPFTQDAVTIGNDATSLVNNGTTNTQIAHIFKRARSFFYCSGHKGSGTAGLKIYHDLRSVPEMVLIKSYQGSGQSWAVYHKDLNSGSSPEDYYLSLNSNAAETDSNTVWNDTAPTDQFVTLGNSNLVNDSTNSYYSSYFFGSVSGVSKVGSYTGTGAALNVDCGFSSGASLIWIKRADSTGDWFVYDSARGINSGNSPYLLFNSNAAEVTNTNYVSPHSSGFTVTADAPDDLNADGGRYVFYAVAAV